MARRSSSGPLYLAPWDGRRASVRCVLLRTKKRLAGTCDYHSRVGIRSEFQIVGRFSQIYIPVTDLRWHHVVRQLAASVFSGD